MVMSEAVLNAELSLNTEFLQRRMNLTKGKWLQ